MKNYLMIQSSNPVLTPDFARKVSTTTDVSRFDLHTHLEDVFAGTTPAFIAEMYSRAAWQLDTQLKNLLKQVARALPKHEGVNSLDNYAEVTNALNEMLDGEAHSYEVGHETTGPLHTISLILDVRQAWHDHAQVAETQRGRTYAVKSIEVQISTPRAPITMAQAACGLGTPSISSNQLANFEFEALKLVGGLSDIKLRGEFRDGINLNEKLMQLERVKRDKNSAASDEQILMYMEQDEDYKLIMSKRAALSNLAARAINHRQALIDDQEAKLQGWYEDEIKLIGTQMMVYDFCNARASDTTVEFHMLPASLQASICGACCVSLDNTLAKLSSKATTLYCTYSLIVDTAKSLLQRVITARCDESSCV